MYYVISSAKTMKPSSLHGSEPLFLNKSRELLALLKAMDLPQLQTTLKISAKLSEEVYALYHDNSYHGLCLDIYDGIVFKNLGFNTLDENSQTFALKHILISSAMYGLLRASDEIETYRLDMLAKIKLNLKQYWHDEVVTYLNELDDIIIDLSSKEFNQVWIKDVSNYYTISFMSEGKKEPIKKLRGLFLKECCLKQVNDLDALKKIVILDYYFAQDLSNNHELVYVKR